jgi:hypothetical protein
MITRKAECSCGQLSATCSGDPVRIAICHCLACKRKTGSAFGYSAWYRNNDVSTNGDAKLYIRIGDDGGRITNSFCPNCGVTLCWTIDTIPNLTAISAGTFADLNFPPPTISVYHQSRSYPWLDLKATPLEKRG